MKTQVTHAVTKTVGGKWRACVSCGHRVAINAGAVNVRVVACMHLSPSIVSALTSAGYAYSVVERRYSVTEQAAGASDRDVICVNRKSVAAALEAVR